MSAGTELAKAELTVPDQVRSLALPAFVYDDYEIVPIGTAMILEAVDTSVSAGGVILPKAEAKKRAQSVQDNSAVHRVLRVSEEVLKDENGEPLERRDVKAGDLVLCGFVNRTFISGKEILMADEESITAFVRPLGRGAENQSSEEGAGLENETA